ncbi:MAG TPA: hypothetical protein VG756_17945 [Pseudonocardiaceae bacterium]|nr:hypothetical protein [Pseudonocardiaceae bacterium]
MHTVMPEEFFLDGPPGDGGGLLRRTIDRVRRESARAARRRLAALIAVALLGLLTAAGIGMIAGQRMALGQPWRGTYTARDFFSGARLAVAATAADTGTLLEVALTGLPPGTGCRLTVLGTDGSRVADGSWRVPASDGVSLSVYLDASLVKAVEVTAAGGVDLVATGP